MSGSSGDDENALRERAYYIWERDGRPLNRAAEHWRRAVAEHGATHHDDELIAEQEAIIDGRPADLPAVLTRDTRGG